MKDSSGQMQRSTLEVDFVCNLGSKRYYLQSTFRMPDTEKMEQEKHSLKLIRDSFRKIIIVGEKMKIRRDENGVVQIEIYEFL